MKKFIALLLAVGMLLALLAGCGGTEKTGSDRDDKGSAPGETTAAGQPLETDGAFEIDDRPASNCWVATASINQRPQGDQGGEYRIQMDATHTNPDLHNAGAVITMTFNQPVEVTNAGGGAWVKEGAGSTVSIEFDIGTANASETKGWGDLAVVSDAGLEIVDVDIQCTGA